MPGPTANLPSMASVSRTMSMNAEVGKSCELTNRFNPLYLQFSKWPKSQTERHLRIS